MLLDAQGHLKLTDFGCAKIMDNLHDVPAATPANTDAHDAQHGAEEPEQRRVEGGAAEEGGSDESHAGSASDAPAQSAGPASGRRPGVRRTVSFVGTADYLAPETLENTSCSCAVDLWALGCVVYQMLVGKTPFRCVRVCQYDSGRRVEWLPPGEACAVTRCHCAHCACTVSACTLCRARPHVPEVKGAVRSARGSAASERAERRGKYDHVCGQRSADFTAPRLCQHHSCLTLVEARVSI